MLIPSQIDPTMAPDGKHYMSVFVQYCPYRSPTASGRRQSAGLRQHGHRHHRAHSPNFKDLILHAEIRTPWDIENEVGLTEGNIFQGELTIDQLLFNRPMPGYAQYRAPVRGMYMCGSSTHPGGGVMGAPGECRARGAARSGEGCTDAPAAAAPVRLHRHRRGHNGLVCAAYLARAAARCWCSRRRPGRRRRGDARVRARVSASRPARILLHLMPARCCAT
jgi:phytoene dehydrogenase-like protein